MPTAHIVIDYQNIHLTGHGEFCQAGEPKHLCLIHPLHFAHQVLQVRNLIQKLISERDDLPFEAATLGTVRVFRGQPSNRNDPKSYARTLAQRSEWTRDARVKVTYRTLKYYTDGEVREKGVDVMIALELVQLAASYSESDDIVILAAHDTDQEPALELAAQLIGTRLETAGWMGAKQLRPKTATQLWHTKLGEDHFDAAIDRKDYQ